MNKNPRRNLAVDPPEGEPGETRAAARRRELEELKRRISGQAQQDLDSLGLGFSRSLLSEEDDKDVRAFVKEFTKTKERRKFQLSLIKDFLREPARFGLDAGDMPTSTTLEEFAERRKDLQYRINLLETVLELANEELKQLSQAEAFAHAKSDSSSSGD